MKKNIFVFYLFLSLISLSVFAQTPNTLNFQARIRTSDGQVLEKSDVNFFFEYTDPNGTCILYQEEYENYDMTASGGLVNFQLGIDTTNPAMKYRKVFSSTGTIKDIFKNGVPLSCKDGSIYNSQVGDVRKLNVKFSYSGSNGWSEINGVKLNSVPFSMHSSESNNSEQLGGIQSSQYPTFSDFMTCPAGQFLTYNGNGLNLNCAAPSASVNFSGSLSGDVTGTQSATVVSSLRGIPLSAVAPLLNQVLQFDGTNYVAATLPSAPVTSVAGKTGTVLLFPGDISGLGNSALLNVGTAAGTVAAGDDSRINSAYTDTQAATNANTASTIVKRDGSGHISVGGIAATTVTATNNSATNFSGRNFLFFDSGLNKITINTPNALVGDYTLILPPTAGSSGYVLSTDGSGVTSWIPAATGSVTSVGVTAPITSTGGATPNIAIDIANTTTTGALTSADWNTFNSKLTSTLAPANIFIGNAGSVATARSLSGDATISNLGILTIANNAVTTPKVNNLAITDAKINDVAFSKITSVPTADTTTTGVLSSTDWNTFNIKQPAGNYITALTGDVMAAGPGSAAATIAASAITTAKLTNLAVTDAKINDVAFSKITGTPTTLSGYGITNAVRNAGVGAGNVINSIQSGNTEGLPPFGTDGRIYIDTQASVIYRDNGTAWVPVASTTGSGGTVTSINTGNGLSGGPITSTGTISLANTSVTAASYGTSTSIPSFNVDAQGRLTAAANNAIPTSNTSTIGLLTGADWTTFNNKLGTASTFSGDVSGTASTISVDRIKGIPATFTSLTSGNLLKYNGSDWVNGNPVIADITGLVTQLSNKLDQSQMPASCGANQTLYFVSVTGSWSCSNIGSLDASTITTGTIASARLPASATYWDAATGGINYLGGSVGIGTANLTTNGLTTKFKVMRPVGYIGIAIESDLGSPQADILFKSNGAPIDQKMAQILNDDTGIFKIRKLNDNNSVDVPFFAANLSTGNVGIGHADPKGTLHVHGTDPIFFDRAAALPGKGSHLLLRSSGGTKALPTAVNSGSTLGKLTFSGYDGTNWSASGASIISVATENWTSSTARGAKLEFRSNANGAPYSVTPNMVIENNGNVGIGMTTPSYKLDVNGDINIPSGSNFKINGVNINSGTVSNVSGTAPISVATGTSTPVISIATANTTTTGALSSTDWNTFNNKLGTSTVHAGDVTGTASTMSVDRIRGTPVTITTLTSGNFLRYNGAAWVNAMLGLSDIPNMDAAHMPAFSGDITTSAGSTVTTLANTAVTPGSYGSTTGIPNFTVDAKGRLTAASNNTNLDASIITSGTIASARLPASATYWSAATGGINYVGGRVGIGTTSPSEKLHVMGNLRVQGSTDCTLGNGSGGTNCTSDLRLKENIIPIQNSLNKVLQLRGVEFDWNNQSISPGNHDIGVIAQEVEKQFPTAVINDSNSGYKKVDYAVLVAPLIQAIKEFYLQWLTENKSVHNDIHFIQQKLNQLNTENNFLKKDSERKNQEIKKINSEIEFIKKDLLLLKKNFNQTGEK